MGWKKRKAQNLRTLWDEDSANVSNHLTHRVASSATGDQMLFFSNQSLAK